MRASLGFCLQPAKILLHLVMIFVWISATHGRTNNRHFDARGIGAADVLVPRTLSRPLLFSSYDRALTRNDNADTERGRTVLTFLYVSVLGICLLTPVLYYIRLHCEERALRRRLQDLHEQGLRGSLESVLSQSQLPDDQQHDINFHHLQGLSNTEDSRAARRKYIAERRARILQLFATVRMTLTLDNFPNAARITLLSDRHRNDKNGCTIHVAKGDDDDEQSSHTGHSVTSIKPLHALQSDYANNAELGLSMSIHVEDEDDQNLMIEIPLPGLPLHVWTAAPSTMTCSGKECVEGRRLASGICSICLSTFEVGSDIVWSSNPACEHVFHEACIEKWLMKQREGPLCPCCRRDFVLDPYDLEEEGEEETELPSSFTIAAAIVAVEGRGAVVEPPLSLRRPPSMSSFVSSLMEGADDEEARRVMELTRISNHNNN